MSFKEIDRNVILEDERVQRLKKIKLLQRENRENAPSWKEKQMIAFPTAIPLSNTPTLGQVITEENQKGSQDPTIIFQRAEAKLLQISDKTNAQYILDRLDDNELFYLINGYDGLIKIIKEKYNQKIDKDIFVRLIQAEAERSKNDLANTRGDVLTQRGTARLARQQDETDEITKKLQDEEKQRELERQAFDAIVTKNQKDKDAQDAKNKILPATKQASRQITIASVALKSAQMKLTTAPVELTKNTTS